MVLMAVLISLVVHMSRVVLVIDPHLPEGKETRGIKWRWNDAISGTVPRDMGHEHGHELVVG